MIVNVLQGEKGVIKILSHTNELDQQLAVCWDIGQPKGLHALPIYRKNGSNIGAVPAIISGRVYLVFSTTPA